MLFGILLRATALVIAGYFIWYTAHGAQEERLKSFGKYLAMWTFAFAVLYTLGSIAMPIAGRHFGFHPGMMAGGMHHRGMGGGMGGGPGRFGMHGGFQQHPGGFARFHHHHDGQNNSSDNSSSSPNAATPNATAPAPAGSTPK